MGKNNTSGFWAILATAAIYGAYGCLARFLNDAFGYYTQVFLRSSAALLVVVTILFLRRFTWNLTRKDIGKVVLLGVSFFGGVVFFTMGSILDKISVVLFVFYAGSFATSFLISTFYYHEKATLQKLLALSLVVIGLLVTTGFNFAHIGWGLGAALMSGVLDAFANNLRKQLAALPKMQVLLLQFAITSALAFLAIGMGREIPLKEVTSLAIGIVFIWGAFWILSNQLIMIGYKHFDFMLAQIVLSSEIFFATILAFIIFREIPNVYELVGGMLIFAGVCTVDLDFSRIGDTFKMLQKLTQKT